MKQFSAIALFLLGISLFFVLWKNSSEQLDTTFSPFFQVIGKVPSSASRVLTQVIPVNDIDEKQLGEELYKRYSVTGDIESKEAKYLGRLLGQITEKAEKPFHYRLILQKTSVKNAYAMPGGVIFMTTGLFNALQSESEILSVLGHEVAHVEQGHCMELVRFELLAKKIDSEELGALIDFSVELLLGHNWSKTHEAEADEYGYRYVSSRDYDRMGTSLAFSRLAEGMSSEDSGEGNIVYEYFSTHPNLKHRIEQYRDRALRDLKGEEKMRYRGVENKNDLMTRAEKEYKEEWLTSEEVIGRVLKSN